MVGAGGKAEGGVTEGGGVFGGGECGGVLFVAVDEWEGVLCGGEACAGGGDVVGLGGAGDGVGWCGGWGDWAGGVCLVAWLWLLRVEVGWGLRFQEREE